MAMSLIDRMIGLFSPRAACARLYYKEALRNYDAGRLDRYGGWVPPQNQLPEETDAPFRSLIRARARDLERNNDVTLGIIGSLQRNVVGSGIYPQSTNEGIKARVAELWGEWIDKKHCDVTGCSTFYELQKMFVRRKYVDGEVFCLFAAGGDGAVPLQLQMVEPDLLDESSVRYVDGINHLHSGVEVDDFMRPVAYHFRLDPLLFETIRVPADRVIHSFTKSRTLQVRGMSGLTAPMERVRDIGEYIDSELKAARIAAAQTGVVKSTQGAASQLMRSKQNTRNGERIQEIVAGTMNYLRPDEDISFPPPGRPNVNAAGFISTILRFVGLSTGLSYEQTARDLSNVNYSSARQGYLEDQRTYKEWQDDLIRSFCQPVYERFMDSAVLSGALRIQDYWVDRAEYTRARWITPGWSWIDPQKEAAAGQMLLAAGLTTREELCGARGKNWREIMQQLKAEQDYADEIGLRLGGEEVVDGTDETDDGGAPQSGGAIAFDDENADDSGADPSDRGWGAAR